MTNGIASQSTPKFPHSITFQISFSMITRPSSHKWCSSRGRKPTARLCQAVIPPHAIHISPNCSLPQQQATGQLSRPVYPLRVLNDQQKQVFGDGNFFMITNISIETAHIHLGGTWSTARVSPELPKSSVWNPKQLSGNIQKQVHVLRPGFYARHLCQTQRGCPILTTATSTLTKNNTHIIISWSIRKHRFGRLWPPCFHEDSAEF